MGWSKAQPIRYLGQWQFGTTYMAGALVYVSEGAFCSRRDYNTVRPHLVSRDWVHLGEMGASPTTVVHAWHAQDLQYPTEDGLMSEPAVVCSDCWKDADYRNAFLPDKHLYIIKELGL